MKKINYLWLAGLALAGCSSEDYLGNEALQSVSKNGEIVFGSKTSALTRADLYASDAATKLGNNFVVTGLKSNTGPTTGQLVFDAFKVNYIEGTAGTTASNTANWEYVGFNPVHSVSNIDAQSQGIKYWDYANTQYDFFAYSLGGYPEETNFVASSVTKDNIGTANSVYTITGSAAQLSQCYISDLYTAYKEDNDYKNTVVLKFRNLTAKVRMAIYETVPGYSVKDVHFLTVDTKEKNQTQNTASLYNSDTNVKFYATNGTYGVTFPTIGYSNKTSNTDYNKAHVKVESSTATNIATFGNLNYTNGEQVNASATTFLGRQSNTASFASAAASLDAGNFYTYVLPYEEGADLKLHVNYTLVSNDGTGETINVTGATAIIPAVYAQWKSNYAYTYIFKISDKTNGTTGNVGTTPDPSGLYPITFDAVVMSNDEGNQETITILGDYSTTTYQNGSDVTVNNEYTACEPIYVMTKNTAGTLVDLSSGVTSRPMLYTAVGLNITEEAVENALNNGITASQDLVLTDASSSWSVTDGNMSIVGVDGNSFKPAAKTAGKIDSPAEKTTYVYVYTQTAPVVAAYTKLTTWDTSHTGKYYLLGDFITTVVNQSTFEANETNYYTYNSKTKVFTQCTDGQEWSSAETYYTATTFADNRGNYKFITDAAATLNKDAYIAAGILYCRSTDPVKGVYATKVIKVVGERTKALSWDTTPTASSTEYTLTYKENDVKCYGGVAKVTSGDLSKVTIVPQYDGDYKVTFSANGDYTIEVNGKTINVTLS